MKIWLVRAGGNGQYEQKFLDENRVYVTWGRLDADLSVLQERTELIDLLEERDPDAKVGKLRNHASQIWPFVFSMVEGDWIILPSKSQPVIHIGKLTSNYCHNPEGPDPFFHYRNVEWFAQDIPRSNFSQDILYSLGAFMTICQIKRNNAAERIEAMAKNNWQPENDKALLQSMGVKEASSKYITNTTVEIDDANDDQSSEIDLEYTAKQQVVSLIERKFKGHDFTRLITAILQAQGFTTWQSLEGADGGVDILASSGAMGFGEQRICVEVKSGTGSIDRPTVDKLLGAMSKFNSDHGLFVAWGGYKQNVQKELAVSFYRLRLWTQDDVLEQLFSVYDKLDDEFKAELPLKRIWTVALTDD
ncbi:restriction endonuclease [Aliikangiella sp. IMCC44359]|uniref:restriction endonuclease n=1 Tax=Aliikangiella sp. IMCC44359 TaxID=3459125 RepID=UPI00403AD7D2